MAKKEDLRMRYLMGFAMIFVVLAHIDGTYDGVFTVSGLFTWFVFTMPIFLFISGYFYNTNDEDHIFKCIYKRFITLVIPYFVCSIVILLFQSLIHRFGFTLGESFTLYNWLVEPWVKPMVSTLSFANWYLLAFFFCSVINVLIHKIVSYVIKKQTARELFLLCLYLLLGAVASYIGNKLGTGSTAVVYLRSVVMLFFVQLGYFYKVYLEKYDNMSNTAYIVIVAVIRFVTVLLFVRLGMPVVYGLHSLENFGYAGIPFFISGIVGIAFWLRISRILGDVGKRIKPLIVISKNTKYIMMFHMTGFFVLNTIFYVLNHIVTVPGFDAKRYISQVSYADATWWKPISLIYLAAGILFSLAIAYFVKWIKNGVKRRFSQ